MLVFTRDEGDELILDGNIVVRVIEVHAGHVRVGITAPVGVRICRAEVVERCWPLPTEDGIPLPTKWPSARGGI